MVSRSAAVAGRIVSTGSGQPAAAAAEAAYTWLTSPAGQPSSSASAAMRTFVTSPAISTRSIPSGSCARAASTSGRAQRAQASSPPATHGPKTQARAFSSSHSTSEAATTRPSSRATRTVDDPRRLEVVELGRDPLALVAEHRGATAAVGLLGRDQVEDLVEGVGLHGGDRHASSSFSRSAADRLPGSAPEAAIRQDTSRRKSLTGVGTP